MSYKSKLFYKLDKLHEEFIQQTFSKSSLFYLYAHHLSYISCKWIVIGIHTNNTR